jgi:hypothetical protein
MSFAETTQITKEKKRAYQAHYAQQTITPLLLQTSLALSTTFWALFLESASMIGITSTNPASLKEFN